LVYQEESDAIIHSVNNPDDKCTKFDNVLPFGIISDSYSNNQIGDYEGMWINAFYEDKQAWKDKDENWAKKVWDKPKTKVSDKWSSIHSANMIHAKLRAVGCNIDSNIEDIRAAFDANMQLLVLTEHNRWVVEQLLGGFRPFYKEEWAEYQSLTEAQKDDGNKKKAEKAHANICSNATLWKEEPGSPKKDEQVTLALIEIIEQKRKFQN